MGGFEVLGLPVRDPFWTALEVGTEEVSDAVCVFEAGDVYRERREHL